MFQRTFLVAVGIALAAILTACGGDGGTAPNRFPQDYSETGSVRQTRHIAVTIDSITIQTTGGDVVDPASELRLIVIGTDEDGNGDVLFCPANEPRRVNVGDTVNQPCASSFTVEEEWLDESFYLLIVAVDEDETSLVADVGYAGFIQLATRALIKFFQTGARGSSAAAGNVPGLLAELTIETLISLAGDELKAYIERKDIIGQQALVLDRRQNWDVDKDLEFITQDGGLHVRMHVSRLVSTGYADAVFATASARDDQPPTEPPVSIATVAMATAVVINEPTAIVEPATPTPFVPTAAPPPLQASPTLTVCDIVARDFPQTLEEVRQRFGLPGGERNFRLIYEGCGGTVTGFVFEGSVEFKLTVPDGGCIDSYHGANFTEPPVPESSGGLRAYGGMVGATGVTYRATGCDLKP